MKASVVIEVKGFESMQERRGSSKWWLLLLEMEIGFMVMRRVMMLLFLFMFGFVVVGEKGDDVNRGNNKLEKEEDDGWGEPAWGGGWIGECKKRENRGMFVPTIKGESTNKQQHKWLPLGYKMQMIGYYAQIELGYGSNVQGLETTATFDPATDEFVIHSPTLTSSKVSYMNNFL
ncbi:acyl-coenzyme A oxidase [Stylosanthes scabra]|uniref:Acyl-coenzyme A oxidase n=1 Tax=Stylosanthes scabra TaxID=79078 RepID=A0ABU6ZL08_9FABA|nr:acyl-coenzyme A oxidase [Stylosanthes scabra]